MVGQTVRSSIRSRLAYAWAYAFSNCRILVASVDAGTTGGETGFAGVKLAATVVDSVFGVGAGDVGPGGVGIIFVSLPGTTAEPGWLGSGATGCILAPGG